MDVRSAKQREAPRQAVGLARGIASVAAIAFFGLGGCSGEPSATTAVVTDSAGVRIVSHSAPSFGVAEEWTLATTPVADVGSGASPDVPLFRVVAVTPLTNGRVVIGMTAPPRVVIANSAGTLSVTDGQGGDGPGEFAGVRSVVRMAPDSVSVWDA